MMISDELTLLDTLEDAGRELYAECGECTVLISPAGPSLRLPDGLFEALYESVGIGSIKVTESTTQVIDRNGNVVHEV